MQEELKPAHTHSVTEASGLHKVFDLNKFTNYRRLIKVAGHVYYFVNSHIKKMKVSYFEMEKYAELQLLKNQQSQFYGNMLPHLKGEVKKTPASISRQLDLFLDENGLIRCSGRFKFANLS